MEKTAREKREKFAKYEKLSAKKTELNAAANKLAEEERKVCFYLPTGAVMCVCLLPIDLTFS